MPASNVSILKNIERLKDDALIDLWNRVAGSGDGDEPTLGQAWARFIEAADQLKLADKIPGSVGRSFRAKYANTAEEPKATAQGPSPKAQRPREEASGPAPAVASAKAGGRRQSASRAASATQKEAAK